MVSRIIALVLNVSFLVRCLFPIHDNELRYLRIRTLQMRNRTFDFVLYDITALSTSTTWRQRRAGKFNQILVCNIFRNKLVRLVKETFRLSGGLV